MTVYERIKQRRKELGLTAEDVAAALNVSRATIYRYESAEIEKVPITAIAPLAKVLHTTPMDIMGWDSDTDVADEVSKEAQKIAKAYDKATPKEQSIVRMTLSEYLDDEQEFQYAAARGNSRIKIPVQDDDDLPENDTIIDGL